MKKSESYFRYEKKSVELFLRERSADFDLILLVIHAEISK